MKIYIELLIVLAIFLLIFFWWIWNSLARRRARKKYNPDDDKARKGEFNYRATGRREPKVEESTRSSLGLEEARGREFLQKMSVVQPRKNRSGIRKLLKRRR